MKQWLTITIVIVLIFVIIPLSSYIGLVNSKKAVDEKMAAIEVQFNKRVDLTDKILNIIMTQAAYEVAVISDISNAGGKLLNASDMAEKAEANKEISEAMTRINTILEAYPDMEADVYFKQYSTELSETEREIEIIRVSYNTAVRVLNRQINSFPGGIIAERTELSEAEYYAPSMGDDEEPII